MERTLGSVCLIGAFIHLVHVESVLRSVLATRYHDPEAPLEEGLATLRRCLDEVAKRLVVTPEKYKVKVVDKDGVREVEI